MTGLLEHREALMALLQGTQPPPKAPIGAAAKRHTPVRPNPVDRLVLRQGNRVRFVETRHITWIEADDTYVRLHEGQRSHLINERLKNVAARLNRRQFVRIHRSTIVNLERIKEIRPHPGGGAIVVLQEGTELKMSRSYYRRLDKLLAGLPSKMRLF
jgi:two-component system LytT family response regulator